ncbi:MAG: Uma2 family endonuclease [Planctomycetota bacterium]
MQIHPSHFTEDDIAERQRLGLDLFDEEWEGVYHVTPAPSVDHQVVLTGLLRFLGALLESRGGGTVLPEVNVFREGPKQPDYRVPDLVFVALGREAIIARDGIRGGAPDAIFEILSPRDESYQKFGFYAAIGVPEILIVGPEERAAEVWALAEGRYMKVPAGADGAVVSRALEVSFRTQAGSPARLELTDRRNPSRRVTI